MIRTDIKELRLSPDDLVRFGLNDVAYIKPVNIHGKIYQAVYAADGTPLMVTKERDIAFAAARQNDLQPTSVH